MGPARKPLPYSIRVGLFYGASFKSGDENLRDDIQQAFKNALRTIRADMTPERKHMLYRYVFDPNHLGISSGMLGNSLFAAGGFDLSFTRLALDTMAKAGMVEYFVRVLESDDAQVFGARLEIIRKHVNLYDMVNPYLAAALKTRLEDEENSLWDGIEAPKAANEFDNEPFFDRGTRLQLSLEELAHNSFELINADPRTARALGELSAHMGHIRPVEALLTIPSIARERRSYTYPDARHWAPSQMSRNTLWPLMATTLANSRSGELIDRLPSLLTDTGILDHDLARKALEESLEEAIISRLAEGEHQGIHSTIAFLKQPAYHAYFSDLLDRIESSIKSTSRTSIKKSFEAQRLEQVLEACRAS